VTLAVARRDICRASAPHSLRIERKASHWISERLGESYDRAQYLDDRRKMMQTWADYLEGLKECEAAQRKPSLGDAMPEPVKANRKKSKGK
jgi:hypothetical protein